MADTLEIFGEEFTNVTGIKATDDQSGTKVYIRPQGTKSISANGTGIDVVNYASVDVNVSAPSPSFQSKTYTVDSAGTATVTADSGYDGLSSVEVSVPSADYEALTDVYYTTVGGQRKWHDEAWFQINEGGDGWITEDGYTVLDTNYNAIPTGTTVSPTESSQTIGGANYMMEGAVTVNAIPSNYVGSGITRRDSTDLSASGATVTVPSGYYSAQASKSVASGTAGTPTATKGTVSNHQVSVTPSVTNTGGYISGGTINGTAVSVSASELVSGTYTVSASGTHDVTNYASASVASGSATASATKGTVSNHSVTVTPSVTRTAGYITAGSANGTAVTVSASELVSGSETKTENGTYDVTNLAELVVDVQGGSVTWETIYNGNVTIVSDSPNYVVINNFTDPSLMGGQTWRVTWNGTQYICPVEIGSDQAQTRFIGNKGIVGYTGDDSNEPFFGYMRTSTQLAFVTTDPAGTIPLKMELQQSSSATLIEKSITANGTYNASDDSADGYSKVTVNVSGGGANIATETMTNSSNQNTSIAFTLPSGRTPKAFFARLTSQIARNSNSRYYYVFDMRWDGSSTGGVAGNTFYMSSGTLTNVTSGYSYSQSGTTFTLSSTGSRSASPGSFYNGTYELVYIY